jgi:hypothetical protein
MTTRDHASRLNYENRYQSDAVGKLDGQTLVDVYVTEFEGDPALCLVGTKGWLLLYHSQDCCESVAMDGDAEAVLTSLIGQQIHSIRETTQEIDLEYGVAQWTFYHINTLSDFATVRWTGESNGYYSIEVSASYVSEDN